MPCPFSVFSHAGQVTVVVVEEEGLKFNPTNTGTHTTAYTSTYSRSNTITGANTISNP
jgi:hypothetical protein